MQRMLGSKQVGDREGLRSGDAFLQAKPPGPGNEGHVSVLSVDQSERFSMSPGSSLLTFVETSSSSAPDRSLAAADDPSMPLAKLDLSLPSLLTSVATERKYSTALTVSGY